LEKVNEIKTFGGTSATCGAAAAHPCLFAGRAGKIEARTIPLFARLRTIVNPPLTPAPLKNRLFCMVYEGMLLFGVLFIAGWLFSTLLQQRHALTLRHAQQVWQFIVLGAYFGWFWTHGGQTLAMKTWRVRVAGRDGRALSWPRALLRYLLAWGWFMPGLAGAWLLGAQGWMLMLIPLLNVVLWAAATRLDPDRQFLHDRIAGTRLVLAPAAKPRDAKRA
jgi:uncharacterized RDD family membrane protein YckC